MSQRTYSEKEVAEIIKRAAELESGKTDKEHDDRPGLSLEELSEIAVEAGLDPANVREAAQQLNSSSRNQSIKTKDEVYAERWITSEFTEEVADLVIADLNHTYNTTHKKKSWKDNILEDDTEDSAGRSKVQITGKSLEWKYDDEAKKIETRVLIQPKKNQIRIRVSKRYTGGIHNSGTNSDVTGYLSYVPLLAAFIVLMSLPYSFFVNAIIAILAFAVLQSGFIPAAKKITNKWAERKEKGKPETKKNITDSLTLDVQNTADDLARLISNSGEKSENSNKIEISAEDAVKTENEPGEENQRKRSRS